MAKKIIHKVKDCNRTTNLFLLLNDDGSWNILCKTQGSHIAGSKHWKIVNCKSCLKLKPHTHTTSKIKHKSSHIPMTDGCGRILRFS